MFNRKEYMKKYRKEHPNKEYHKIWNKDHPEIGRKAINKYRKNHPEIVKAEHMAQNRKIPLGSECELCPEDDKKTETLERHHPDYLEPLIIVTVCKECHEGID